MCYICDGAMCDMFAMVRCGLKKFTFCCGVNFLDNFFVRAVGVQVCVIWSTKFNR